MKDLFKILLVAVGISVFITACDTDAEIKDPANLTDPDRSEQYYDDETRHHASGVVRHRTGGA